VAYDRQQVAEPFSTLQVDNAADWARLQVAPDSVARFLNILSAQYGLPAGRQVGLFDRSNTLNTIFGRLDCCCCGLCCCFDSLCGLCFFPKERTDFVLGHCVWQLLQLNVCVPVTHQNLDAIHCGCKAGLANAVQCAVTSDCKHFHL
jgi:hypothetical protein